jgi:hypothetical protein
LSLSLWYNIKEKEIMTTGTKVVQSKGDIQGRVGVILEIIGDRAKVKWEGGYLTTKIKLTSLSDAAIPYTVTPWSLCKQTGRQTYAKYQIL